MKVHLVSRSTEAKIKIALFLFYIAILHMLAFAGGFAVLQSLIDHKIIGPF